MPWWGSFEVKYFFSLSHVVSHCALSLSTHNIYIYIHIYIYICVFYPLNIYIDCIYTEKYIHINALMIKPPSVVFFGIVESL